MTFSIRTHRAKHWLSAAATSTGHHRKRNQDTYLVDNQAELWAVADGMGGGDRGELASQMAVEALLNVPPHIVLSQRFQRSLDALRSVNYHLCCEKTLTSGAAMMGTTIVAVMAEHGLASLIWAGDSRCYLHRKGVTFQISEDHSLVQHWMNSRRISREEAQASVKSNVITKAIGAEPELTLQSAEFELVPGDLLLLCSDGLYQELSEQQIHHAMHAGQPEWMVRTLMTLALAGEARDNITLVAMKYK